MKDKTLYYLFYLLVAVLLLVLCLYHDIPYLVVFCLSVFLFYRFQRKSAQSIEERESRIANLESELLDIKQMKNVLEEQIWKQKEILLCTNNQVELTNHTKASISATRRRLYEKIFWEDGSPQKLDEFIRSL